MYAVGDTVQDFTLPNQNGEMITLSQYRGKKVLVWFYPKASTPGCTAEGCSLRDNFEDLSAKMLSCWESVWTLSKDKPTSSTNTTFPYDLLADTEGVVVKAFGAWGPKKFMGKIL